ncbi:MAG: ribonuclease M5 [Mogibacterium sp.]|nr:ribonuclease M5 [Mogibacterium sp.]
MEKLKLSRAVVVEGRDDVRAVGEACDALIIPTHGYGISKETWQIIEKAHKEKGLIILTDPDHAGSEIRRKLSEKLPDSVQAHIDRGDATDGTDIGVENAGPEIIAEAILKALELAGRISENGEEASSECIKYADMGDLNELGLAGAGGASEKRAKICKELGIGYCNASSLIKKLKGFGIDIDELKKAVEKCK